MLLVIARRHELWEHVGNHQVQITEKLVDMDMFRKDL